MLVRTVLILNPGPQKTRENWEMHGNKRLVITAERFWGVHESRGNTRKTMDG